MVTSTSYAIALYSDSGCSKSLPSYDFSANETLTPGYGLDGPTDTPALADNKAGLLTVYVKNSGTKDTGSLTITNNDTTHFQVSATSLSNIASGSNASFTVQPVSGFTIMQTYSTSVTIKGANGLSATLSVSFLLSPSAATGAVAMKASLNGVKYYTSLADAVADNSYSPGPSYPIILLSDISLSSSIDIPSTLINTTYISGGHTIKCTSGAIFTVSGGSLSIDGGTVLDGSGNGGSPLVTLSSGSLTLNSATLQNNNISPQNGGAISVTGGTLAMNSGSTITGCTADYGGAVYVDGGTFNMNNGSINDNNGDYGAGVYLNSGTFNLSGSGVLKGNVASSNGGGVYMTGSTSTFSMSGGTIGDSTYKNKAGSGAGVYIDNGTFTLSNGSIAGNTATGAGGGVYVGGSGKLIMDGGTIKGNTSGSNGGGVYVYSGTFTINHGLVYGADSGSYAYYGPSSTPVPSGSGNSGGYPWYAIGGQFTLGNDGYISTTSYTAAGSPYAIGTLPIAGYPYTIYVP
jgi:hypothetical protein